MGNKRRMVAAAVMVGALGTAAAYFSHSNREAALRSGGLPLPAASHITPPGVTTVDVVRENAAAADQYLWTRLGDEAGNPLYTYDEDIESVKSACIEECAKEFPPFIAADNAQAFDVWTLVVRDDGSKQWAYQGKPLYRYAGERQPPGPGIGVSSGGATPAGLLNPASDFYSPASGWRRAAYTPEKPMSLPAEVRVKHLMTAGGYALVTIEGKTLYFLAQDGERTRTACLQDGSCKDPWVPLSAPSLASATGDFAVVAATDGTAQWAYKGASLYTFSEDYSPGDVEGMSALGQVALVYRDYTPANIAVVNLPGRGWILATKERKPLYSRHSYKLQFGGRELRNGYLVAYETAKRLGTQGCNAECLQEYRPFEVPPDAEFGGNWQIAIREDGTRQWMYMGSALYTYAGDRQPGDLNGGNRWDFVYGHSRNYDLSVTGGDDLGGIRTRGSALFWRPVEF